MTDDAKLGAIRAELPAVAQYAYLNAGTNGPMTRACAEAQNDWVRAELEDGRIGPKVWERTMPAYEAGRAAVERLLNAPVGSVALTQSTTSGMTLATFELDWRPGDEIVTTDVEHFGGVMGAAIAERRFGVRTRFAKVGNRGGDISAAIEAEITDRTRLLCLSHVSYSTGALFDLRSLIDLCRQRGIAVAVDGAQSAGAIPIDVAALDVDYYAIPGQKWLCGPSASGALYVRPDRLEERFPPRPPDSHFVEVDDLPWFQGVRRFERSSKLPPSSIVGLTASVEWLLDSVGLAWATERARLLTEDTITRLRAIPGVEVITPDHHATLICFRLAGVEPDDLVAELTESGVLTRSVHETNVVRFAIGFYNSLDDIDRAIEIVKGRASRAHSEIS